MCARRFLILIFILILLFVAGAFALFQFGDRVLLKQATPVGHYQQPQDSSAPDYSMDSSWLAKPGLPNDTSGWVPKGVVTTKTAAPAATFYIHPTTYLRRDRWNAPLNPGGEPEARAQLFVQSQASAFNSVSDIWAPRYRQASFGAFLLKSDDARKALDLAYSDVLTAFDAFLAKHPDDEPIILAGHSQGSLQLSRLLVDRKEALKGRLVAAYVVGWPLSIAANPDLVLDAWKGTKGPTGVERRREDMLCTNPLTGMAGGIAAPAVNRGTLVPDGNFANASLAVGQVGARCEKGFLIIGGDVPNLGPYVLPGNNYHVYDYALFWGSIRADAERRLAAWRTH